MKDTMYRATKLWNDMILAFRSGMPIGRHRRYMKSYDSCFIASEGVDWLHEELKDNPNFGPKVTRNQTLQLMQKFQKARVFEDCRGNKYNKDEFSDNGRLYRFVETNDSPVKVLESKTPVRAPLSTQSAMMNSVQRPLRAPLLDKGKQTDDGECKPFMRSLKPQEIEDVWKSVSLNWLQKALQLTNLDDILDSDYVNAQNIIHNVTHVNRNGVVTNIDREDQLPKWVLSAMRCLAHWPMKVEGDLPDYPGFEKDVYNTVTGYFQGLKEPLLTYSMYEVFTNVFVCAENMGRTRHTSRHNSAQNTPKQAHIGLTSYASVENLMANLTMHAESMLMPPPGPKVNGATDDDQRNGYIADPGYDADVHNADITLPPDAFSRSRHIGLARIQMPPPSAPPPPPPPRSSSLFSAALIETSFGVDNNEPRTRVYANLPPPKTQESSQLDPFFDPYAQSMAATRRRHVSGGDQKDTNANVYASTMSMYQTWREDDAVFDAESKCYSMSDVHNIAPCPENELARKSSRNPSWGSVNSVTKDSDTDSCQYGYTVVLSRTPKSERSGRRVRQSSVGDNITNDHCYSRSMHNGLNHLDRDVVSTSDLHRGAPPPYRPPPRYERHAQHQSPVEDAHEYRKLAQSSRNSRTSTTSVSSYESARSHLSPNSDSPGSVNGYHHTPSPDSHNMSGEHRGLRGARSKVNLADSYQLAIDGSCTTPTGKKLFGSSLRRAYSSPNLLSPVTRNRVQEALQICCLLLPPANRRKLHLLLRLMSKMANNEELRLDDQQTTRDMVLQSFSRCIVRSADETDFEEELVLRLVTFLVDNYNDVMKVPESLKLQVDDRITHMRRNKMKCGWDNPASSSSSLSYCEQVSVEQYEIQKMSSSQRALQDLLENIIHDRKMNPRDKKKRLKQFQKNHPDVYSKRFPTSESEAELFPNKPKIKPPLLSKPLQKLKSFRI